MNKLCLLILSILLLSMSIKAQNKIDRIFVYKFFKERGYTTAGAFSQFRKLKEEKIELLEVNPNDRDRIISIINNADCKKHKQTKLGVGLLFCKFFIENKMDEFLIESNVVTNLTSYRNYWIKNQSDQIWLEDFIKQNKGGYL